MDMCKDSEEKHVDVDCDCVVPVTPDAVRENGDFDIQFQSPLTLTVVRKQLNQARIDSPRTPKDVVFDPFAPGRPDDDMERREPHSNKYLDEFSRNTVARQLNFQPFHRADQLLSDEDIFVSVYQNLLQFIVSKQTEGFLAQFSNGEYDSESEDDCKTPPSLLPFSGIADTCPGAPLKLKPARKPSIIQVGLCKKLEF